MLNLKDVTVISLGYSCETAAFLAKQSVETGKKLKLCVFDRMATPMWAVTQLVCNNFANLFDHVEPMHIFEQNPNKWLVDTQYYIRLSPQMGDDQYTKYKSVILARAQQFFQTLNDAAETGQSVLFIRTQEPSTYSDYGVRIIYPQFQTQYQTSEHIYLQQFSQYIKSKYPKLHFQILFMNEDGVFADVANNIIGIAKPSGDYRDPHIGKLIEENIKAHSAHLSNHYTK